MSFLAIYANVKFHRPRCTRGDDEADVITVNKDTTVEAASNKSSLPREAATNKYRNNTLENFSFTFQEARLQIVPGQHMRSLPDFQKAKTGKLANVV